MKWTESCEKAFQELQNSLSMEPILLVADPKKPFVLQTDASNLGVGAVLSQTGDDQMEHPVAFASRRLLLQETRYYMVEKECLAIVWALNCFKDNNAPLMRWTLQIQSYRFDLKYRRGSLNANADGLSQAGKNERMMADSAEPDPPQA